MSWRHAADSLICAGLKVGHFRDRVAKLRRRVPLSPSFSDRVGVCCCRCNECGNMPHDMLYVVLHDKGFVKVLGYSGSRHGHVTKLNVRPYHNSVSCVSVLFEFVHDHQWRGKLPPTKTFNYNGLIFAVEWGGKSDCKKIARFPWSNGEKRRVSRVTSKDVPVNQIGTIYQAVIKSTMIYGTESWAMGKENEHIRSRWECFAGYMKLRRKTIQKVRIFERERTFIRL